MICQISIGLHTSNRNIFANPLKQHYLATARSKTERRCDVFILKSHYANTRRSVAISIESNPKNLTIRTFSSVSGFMSFNATSSFIFLSSTLYTLPIPPFPNSSMISYLPANVLPRVSFSVGVSKVLVWETGSNRKQHSQKTQRTSRVSSPLPSESAR